jgi:superfamily I DNA/RNA helicase
MSLGISFEFALATDAAEIEAYSTVHSLAGSILRIHTPAADWIWSDPWPIALTLDAEFLHDANLHCLSW